MIEEIFMERGICRVVLFFSLAAMAWLSGTPVPLSSARMNQIAIAVSHSIMRNQGCDVPAVVNRLESTQYGSSFQLVRWRTVCLEGAGNKALQDRKWDEAIAYLEEALQSDPLKIRVIETLASARYDG